MKILNVLVLLTAAAFAGYYPTAKIAKHSHKTATDGGIINSPTFTGTETVPKIQTSTFSVSGPSTFTGTAYFTEAITVNNNINMTGNFKLNGITLADSAWQSAVVSAPGTWSVPATSSMVFVSLCGGGGAGGGATVNSGAGGGASGAVLMMVPVMATHTANIAVSAIGAAGAGGSNADGGAGGNTTITYSDLNGISHTLTAMGGAGGYKAGNGGRNFWVGTSTFTAPSGSSSGGSIGSNGVANSFGNVFWADGGGGGSIVNTVAGNGGGFIGGAGAGPTASRPSGGGGGTGILGFGVGGAGSSTGAGSAATGNCNGGGGAAYSTSAGGNGSAGIVVFHWVGPP